MYIFVCLTPMLTIYQLHTLWLSVSLVEGTEVSWEATTVASHWQTLSYHAILYRVHISMLGIIFPSLYLRYPNL